MITFVSQAWRNLFKLIIAQTRRNNQLRLLNQIVLDWSYNVSKKKFMQRVTARVSTSRGRFKTTLSFFAESSRQLPLGTPIVPCLPIIIAEYVAHLVLSIIALGKEATLWTSGVSTLRLVVKSISRRVLSFVFYARCSFPTLRYISSFIGGGLIHLDGPEYITFPWALFVVDPISGAAGLAIAFLALLLVQKKANSRPPRRRPPRKKRDKNKERLAALEEAERLRRELKENNGRPKGACPCGDNKPSGLIPLLFEKTTREQRWKIIRKIIESIV